MFTRRTLVNAWILLCGSVFCFGAPIDSGVFTTYTEDTAKTTLNWIVCGSIPPDSGCFGSGQLSPFGKIGSVIEGSKTYNMAKGTVTRYLYVVDQAYGSSHDGVALYAYKRVDTIANGFDTIKFTLAQTVPLTLTGGTSALTFVGANQGYLVIGTNMTSAPVEVTKSTFSTSSLGIIGQIPIAITADNYGYITVTSAGGFFVIGPNGSLQEDGGGSPFTVNTITGFQP